jgi:dTDP-4-amino-4,6-dideoxygalactose transaminase
MPPYRGFKKSTDLKICNDISSKGLSLPSSINLSSLDIDFITNNIILILKEYG